MNVIVGICLLALGVVLYAWTSLIIFPGIFSLIGIVSIVAGVLEKNEGE